MRLTILCGVSILLLLPGIRAARGAKPAPKPAATSKPYLNKPGHFSIGGYGKPQEKTTRISTSAGEVALKVFDFGSGDPVQMVSYGDYPATAVNKPDPNGVLDRSRDGFVANVKGTLLDERKINVGKIAGRDFHVETEGGLLMRVRVFLAGTRIYQIVSASPKAKFDKARAGKFLNAFKLLK